MEALLEDNITVSAYVRSLIIRDLVDRGMLDDETLTKMLVGAV